MSIKDMTEVTSNRFNVFSSLQNQYFSKEVCSNIK